MVKARLAAPGRRFRVLSSLRYGEEPQSRWAGAQV